MKTKAVILDVSQITFTNFKIGVYRILVEDEETFKIISNYLFSAIDYQGEYDNVEGYHGFDIITDYRISNEHIEIIKALVDDYRLFTLYDDTEVPDGYTGWVRSQNIKWEE